MIHAIIKPELLELRDGDDTWFGGWQEWYSDKWRRMSGCGPTCALNIMDYLAQTRAHCRALYPEGDATKEVFCSQMDGMYERATPGPRGLNKIERFVSGVCGYALERGCELTPHALPTSGVGKAGRADVSELLGFIAAGLDSDCPVAFLNLAQGKEKRLQSWHWITVTALGADGEAQASDEGKLISFNVKTWYSSTPKRGGFVWFE